MVSNNGDTAKVTLELSVPELRFLHKRMRDYVTVYGASLDSNPSFITEEGKLMAELYVKLAENIADKTERALLSQ